jgi:hypothetical protein
VDVDDIWLERCKEIRELSKNWSRIERASRHYGLSPHTCDVVVIDSVLMNGVPACLQHPDLFSYNDVFSAGLLISIVCDEDLHG